VTRHPLEALALALADAAIGTALLLAALSHGPHREVLVEFFVYSAILVFFKARDANRRLPALIAQSRARTPVARGPWWLRLTRLVIGYDTWSRTERFGLIAIAVLVCTLFGFDDGGPFAAALFCSVAAVDLVLALVALIAPHVLAERKPGT
jgi:hypothetical protein